ncbi:hypothetical protein [Paraburkholderia kururiensis]|nr:hypothetical protein [Paraburkholderia kururiensis]
MTTPILIIEPVARGFRLEVLASAISAIRKRSMYPIFIITRMDFASTELTRLDMSAWQQVHIVQAPVDFGGATMGRLDAVRMDALLNACAEMVNADQDAQLIFLGADDYLDAFSAHASTLKQRFARSRVSVSMPNTEDLIARQLKASGKSALGRQAVASLNAADATLIAFDDALRGHRIGQREVVVLPDPWHGHFATAQRRRSRERFKFAPAMLVMAAALDPAAGGDPASWLGAAERLAEVPGVHLALHGKVRALDRPKLRRLVERFGPRVSHTGSAAASDDVARDVQLLAAADVMLTSLIGAADSQGADGLCEHTPLSEAQQARLNGFGAAFDHEAARQLVASADALRLFSGKEMALLRDTLERHAQDLLVDSFGAGLRAALGVDA